MKNLIFISAFTFLFNWTATAAGHISRDSSWTYGGNGGLNLSQVSLNNCLNDRQSGNCDFST